MGLIGTQSGIDPRLRDASNARGGVGARAGSTHNCPVISSSSLSLPNIALGRVLDVELAASSDEPASLSGAGDFSGDRTGVLYT
jgi:hypothetical protein